MRALLALLSWAIVAFGQPAWIGSLAPLAAVGGYALFWHAIRSSSSKFWLGTAWFAAVQSIQLSWMTATDFQGYYILGVYAALCFCLGLQFGALTLTIGRWPHLAVAGLWTLFEWSRLYFLCGFSWNPVGLSLTANVLSLQAAALFGIFGLSFCVMLTNLALLHKRWKPFAACALFPYLFGGLHILVHQNDLAQSPKLSVALVQTGLMPPEKIPLKGQTDRFIPPFEQWRRIFESLKEAGDRFDLVVLPECAVPLAAETQVYAKSHVYSLLRAVMGRDVPLKTEGERISNRDWVQTVSDLFSAEVVAGLDAEEGGRHFASAFYAAPHVWERYDKRILVPLAEYLPFSWLKKWTADYGITEFFTHGKEAKVFRGKVPFSVSICYEETFPSLMREGRQAGAELFVNATNDNWYPSSRLPRQHCDHARVRTVENGVPLVRACNTGVTAAFDSLGRRVGSLAGERRREVLVAKVPMHHYRTLYLFWGDAAIVGVSLLCLLISIERWRNYLTCWKRKL